ncbi:MAG: hypothetical protein AAGG48_06980 [Planctomycetota bacterium]
MSSVTDDFTVARCHRHLFQSPKESQPRDIGVRGQTDTSRKKLAQPIVAKVARTIMHQWTYRESSPDPYCLLPFGVPSWLSANLTTQRVTRILRVTDEQNSSLLLSRSGLVGRAAIVGGWSPFAYMDSSRMT